ncbi:MAG TPA: ATP-binding cassette domain-containing protein [Candidatus Acidoferrales bacterium]|jgi:putative ABC transport system ATP-binding protein|nr:ATP-binding cassette domain-containing protein [Candidatus Acidoferrales bacterium]
MLIELKNVTRVYKSNVEVKALDDVSLTVAPGEWLAIMGPSGSGKSTLVNLIGCLDQPTRGEIWIHDANVSQMSSAELNRFRAEKIGFIFQQFHLIPYLTAIENVMLAQYFHSMTDKAEALAALERVGLADRADHLPSQLSGGEQQRVCIARALINDPQVVLADEPTGNLDAQNEELVLRQLRELHAQGRTIIMVTHDPAVAHLADRLLELHHGKIASQQQFVSNDEEQFDEVLEELWVLAENGEPAELGRVEVEGSLPMPLAVERMQTMGLVELQQHTDAPHSHKRVLNRCHVAFRAPTESLEHGEQMIIFTEKGRRRAEDIIRRHRLAERLFTQTFQVEDEKEIAEQACRFEHILSPEATDRICTFLGHPRMCPHGSPIPAGPCCIAAKSAIRSENVFADQK